MSQMDKVEDIFSSMVDLMIEFRSKGYSDDDIEAFFIYLVHLAFSFSNEIYNIQNKILGGGRYGVDNSK